MNNSLGKFLAEKRKERSLTQKDLAGKLFVSESTVSKWETDAARPDIALIPKLCEILQVTEHELITASEDAELKETKSKAKKWNILTFSWRLFFFIAYGIAVLVCFIVNLAVNKTLSWFFIVLAALILAATFTTLPGYIKKYRLLIITLSQLGALILLLGVCCIYSHGTWFFVAAAWVIFAFAVVFLPIYIHLYNLPDIIKKNKAISCVAGDYAIMTVAAIVTQIDSAVRGDGQPWLFTKYLPLSLLWVAIPVSFILLIRYTKLNSCLKAGLCTLSFGVLFPTATIVQDLLNKGVEGVRLPNFANWSVEFIEGNVMCISAAVVLSAALVLIVIGLVQHLRK